MTIHYIWASMRENLPSGGGGGGGGTTKGQTSLCYPQSDQRLCYSLTGKYHL